MPRLAGQQPEYLANQLQAFIERKRTNPVMNNVAHVLSPEMVTALSEYFNSLNPKPLGGGNPALVPEGKKIFEEGIPSTNVPPCASCHGPHAQGVADFPRLAGQHAKYVTRQIEYIQGLVRKAPVMHGIVKDLTPEEIQAIAIYVQSL